MRMAFPPVPNYSKNQIKKAGKILINQKSTTPSEIEEALEIVNAWRVCHGYPINTFRSTLTVKTANGYGQRLIAQRLKRLPTIIDKLKRYPNMQLTTMQDIGGLRAVLNNMKDVYKLVDEYNDTRFEHQQIGFNDYVENPRSEDGYRSVHLIYSYTNNRGQAKQYNGLRIELQFRTRLQHSWATAVETMGAIVSQSLKSRQGDKHWLDFFALLSSAFAHIEKMPLVPGYDHMSREETFKAVAESESRLKVLERLNSMRVAVDYIDKHNTGRYFHLIVLRPAEHRVTLESFKQNEYSAAVTALEAAEKEAALPDANIDPVLVAAGDLKSLKQAYPNYFLDVQGFIDQVRRIIKEYP